MFPFQKINNEEFSNEFTSIFNINKQRLLTLSDIKLLDAENCNI